MIELTEEESIFVERIELMSHDEFINYLSIMAHKQCHLIPPLGESAHSRTL